MRQLQEMLPADVVAVTKSGIPLAAEVLVAAGDVGGVVLVQATDAANLARNVVRALGVVEVNCPLAHLIGVAVSNGLVQVALLVAADTASIPHARVVVVAVEFVVVAELTLACAAVGSASLSDLAHVHGCASGGGGECAAPRSAGSGTGVPHAVFVGVRIARHR